MIILTTSTAAQTLSVIPREYFDSFTMTIRDDSTNVTNQYDITGAVNLDNYLTFDNIFNPILVEGRFYDIQLFTDSSKSENIYNDKIFCTDQDIDQLNENNYYQINKDQYTFYNGSDNTYTVR
tara:strand:+ start:291 stop:659 length:369 start_codon:yes stop_codon:yes gene_type:complete